MFRLSFQQIKQHTDLDFKNMKSNKDDLLEKDFADLDWFGIATQRRGLEPEGEWASQPQTQLLCREDGAVKACSSSFAALCLRAWSHERHEFEREVRPVRTGQH
ncbi:hypothetical protein LTR17_020263 [Elasticomyces elasticus]|nr:hypothetical protein LTR17_020263 [Elasticomyces elasticus]